MTNIKFPGAINIESNGPKAWIVLNKFDPIPWKKVATFNDIRNGVYWGLENAVNDLPKKYFVAA